MKPPKFFFFREVMFIHCSRSRSCGGMGNGGVVGQCSKRAAWARQLEQKRRSDSSDQTNRFICNYLQPTYDCASRARVLLCQIVMIDTTSTYKQCHLWLQTGFVEIFSSVLFLFEKKKEVRPHCNYLLLPFSCFQTPRSLRCLKAALSS